MNVRAPKWKVFDCDISNDTLALGFKLLCTISYQELFCLTGMELFERKNGESLNFILSLTIFYPQ